MTHQQRVAMAQFLDDTQAIVREERGGMPIGRLYEKLSDKVSPNSFAKLITILVVTERCQLDEERLYAQPTSTAV